MSSQERRDQNITDKMIKGLKYHLKVTRKHVRGKQGFLEKIQEVAKDKKYNMTQTIPEDDKIKNLVAYSLKINGYEIALSVERYKNSGRVLKEKLEFQGTDQQRDSNLVNKIIGDLK